MRRHRLPPAVTSNEHVSEPNHDIVGCIRKLATTVRPAGDDGCVSEYPGMHIGDIEREDPVRVTNTSRSTSARVEIRPSGPVTVQSAAMMFSIAVRSPATHALARCCCISVNSRMGSVAATWLAVTAQKKANARPINIQHP